MTEQKTLQAALVSAQRTVDVASKDARNEHHRYEYASAEEIVSVASVALSGAGLAFSEERSEFSPFAVRLLGERANSKDRAQGDGVGGALGILTVTYGLVHADSGERSEIVHDFPVVPEKGRPLDKALAASRTECLAYALRGLLLIERRPKDQKGQPKRPRKTPPLDVSGRSDLPKQPAPSTAAPRPESPAPSPTPSSDPPLPPAADPAPDASRSPRPEASPAPSTAQIEAAALIAPILNATTLTAGLTALAMARRNKSCDASEAEKAFASFILRKVEMAKDATRLDWLQDIEGYLARAGIGAEAARRCREAIKEATAIVRRGGAR